MFTKSQNVQDYHLLALRSIGNFIAHCHQYMANTCTVTPAWIIHKHHEYIYNISFSTKYKIQTMPRRNCHPKKNHCNYDKILSKLNIPLTVLNHNHLTHNHFRFTKFCNKVHLSQTPSTAIGNWHIANFLVVHYTDLEWSQTDIQTTVYDFVNVKYAVTQQTLSTW